jgi:N-acetylneuraminic acid mutarotase
MAMSKKSTFLLTLVLFISTLTLALNVVSAETVQENSWSTKTSIPQVQGGMRAATVDGNVYVIGGNLNLMYNPDTDEGTAKKTMPTQRSYFGIAVYENKIYTIGGGYWDGGWVTSNVNEAYDPLTDSWETKTAMSTSRMSLNANEVDGKIYLIGGQTGGPNSIVDVNEVYNVATDSWTTKTKGPYAVDAYGSAVVDGKIYIIGGSAAHSAYVSLNQIYEPSTDTWSFGAEMPEAVRDGATGVTSGILAPKRIYIIGGGPDMLAFNYTQVYNPENDSWTLGAQMPTSRGWLTVAVANDLIYAIGGAPYLMGSPLLVNEQYTPFGYSPSSSSQLTPSVSPQFSTAPAEAEPFFGVTTAVTIAVLGVFTCVGLLFYQKKRKHRIASTANPPK